MICEETTNAHSSSIAWAIEPTTGDRFRIIIRSVCVDGVEIDGKTLTEETIKDLRDVVENSPEYDHEWLTEKAKEHNRERYFDAMDDNRMDDLRTRQD